MLEVAKLANIDLSAVMTKEITSAVKAKDEEKLGVSFDD